MWATISGDIVSSTSLSENDTIKLKQHFNDLFKMLEDKYPGFWGRQIKGDYIECAVPNANNALRIALLIKSSIKSFDAVSGNELFAVYGLRMAIGIGSMRIVNRESDLMDGESIYLSGRTLAGMSKLSKGSLSVASKGFNHINALQTIAVLTDAIMNKMTRRQAEVIFYKLSDMKEIDIAEKLSIRQSSVNARSSSAQWYSIEEAIHCFEHLNFEAK